MRVAGHIAPVHPAIPLKSASIESQLGTVAVAIRVWLEVRLQPSTAV